VRTRAVDDSRMSRLRAVARSSARSSSDSAIRAPTAAGRACARRSRCVGSRSCRRR
jgi:hypothetical protein